MQYPERPDNSRKDAEKNLNQIFKLYTKYKVKVDFIKESFYFIRFLPLLGKDSHDIEVTVPAFVKHGLF